jgi:hypothetical protein
MTTHHLPLNDCDDQQPDFAPELPGFDDAGNPVPKTWNPFREPPTSAERFRRALIDAGREAILGTLAMIADGTPRDIARKATILAWIMGAREFRTQREIAAFLNITDARVSQIRAQLLRDYPTLQRLRSREKSGLI